MSLTLVPLETERIQVLIPEENKTINIVNETVEKITVIEPILYTPLSMTVQKFVLRDYENSLEIYAPDGVTLVAKIDSNGNLGIRGQIYTI